MTKGGDARKTDAEKKAEALAGALKAKRLKRDSQVIAATFHSDNGKRALRLIMDRCNYQKPITYVDNAGKICTENMIHNAAMQGFYLWLRKQIDPETLILVENKGLQEDILE